MARLEREHLHRTAFGAVQVWHDEKYDVSKFCEFYLDYSRHSPIRGIRDRRICDFKKALFRVGGGLDIFRATLYNRVQYEGVIFPLGKSRLFLFNFFSLKGEYHEHTDQPVSRPQR